MTPGCPQLPPASRCLTRLTPARSRTGTHRSPWPGSTVPSTVIGEFMVSAKRATPGLLDCPGFPDPVHYRPRAAQHGRHYPVGPDEHGNAAGPDAAERAGPAEHHGLQSDPGGIPNAGTPFTLTITMSQVANEKSKIMRSKDLIGYSNTFAAVANSHGCRRLGRSRPGHCDPHQ